MTRIAPGAPPAAPAAKVAVPWWVLPAIVLSGLTGALMARWIDASAPPPPAAPQATAPAAALAAASAIPLAPASAPAPPAAAAAADWSLSGVLMVDGRPAMALVSVGRAPAALLRAGDRLSATAVLASIEANAIWVQDGALRTRVPMSGAWATTARTLAPALPPDAASTPRVAAGAAVATPPAETPGTGNAAFRAAVEEKLKAMNR